MSVINQMLRDLDARAASEQERAGLPARLRPLPATPRMGRQGKWLLLAAGAISIAVVASAYWQCSSTRERKAAAQPKTDSVSSLPMSLLPPVVVAPAFSSSVEMNEPTSEPREVVSKRLALSLATKPVMPAPGVPASEAKKTGLSEEQERTTMPFSVPAEERSSLTPSPAPRLATQPFAPNGQITLSQKGSAAQKEVEASYREGMAAFYRGEREVAEKHLRAALAADPSAAAPRQALLAILADARRFAEARSLAEEGLLLQPQRADWALIAARLQYETGEHQAALATLERHAIYAEQMADYHGFLAFLLGQAGKRQEAAERYRRAVSLKPSEGRWWYGLGTALEMLGDPEGAREAYRQAMASGNLPEELAGVAEKKAKK